MKYIKFMSINEFLEIKLYPIRVNRNVYGGCGDLRVVTVRL